MKFSTFGSKDMPAVLLMHGMMQKWESVYKPLKELEKHYYLIVPAMDGFYEGSDDFTDFADQARQIEEFVKENCGGHLLGVYGVSQGATLMTELLARNHIKVDKAVLDGVYLAHQGNFSAMCMSKMFIKMKQTNGVPPKPMKVVMKLMGLSEKEYKYLSDNLCFFASDNSIKRNSYENYNFRLNVNIADSDTKVFMICGSKEPYALKSHKILKKYLKNYKEKVFKGLGHGQMLMYHSEELSKNLVKFFG